MGATVSKLVARDVKREIQVVSNDRLSEGLLTVRIRTNNVLYMARGLEDKADFDPPVEMPIAELWAWSGAEWGGPTTKID